MRAYLQNHRLAATGVTVLALALLGAALWVFATHWHPSDDRYAFQGIELDETQGPIHWPTIAADGVDFAYMRATFGASGRDRQFATSWADAGANDMRRGAVHVWSFCLPAADQANNFNTTVPKVDDALPAAVFIDFDPDCTSRPPRERVIGEVRRFATMVESHTGKPILLKITPAVESTYRLSAGIDRPIWSIGNFIPPNYAARPWRMWQSSDMRRIDGLTGPVHWNVVAP